jgi:hypothetical protein
MKMLYDWNEAGIPHWTRYKANIVVILHKKKGPCEACLVITKSIQLDYFPKPSTR